MIIKRKEMMNMKMFTEPEMDIQKFMVEDILNTSDEQPVDPDQGEII